MKLYDNSPYSIGLGMPLEASTIGLGVPNTDNGLAALRRLMNGEQPVQQSIAVQPVPPVASTDLKSLIDLGIQQGHLTEDSRAVFNDLAKTHPDEAKQYLSDLTGVKLAAQPGAIADTSSAPAARAGWTYDDYAEKVPKELELMQANNLAMFNKLTDEKVALARSKYSF